MRGASGTVLLLKMFTLQQGTATNLPNSSDQNAKSLASGTRKEEIAHHTDLQQVPQKKSARLSHPTSVSFLDLSKGKDRQHKQMMDTLILSNYGSVEGSQGPVIAFILMKWENATKMDS